MPATIEIDVEDRSDVGAPPATCCCRCGSGRRLDRRRPFDQRHPRLLGRAVGEHDAHNLRERLELNEQEWERTDGEARQVVAEAVAFAKAGTDPKPEDALLNVYAGTEG